MKIFLITDNHTSFGGAEKYFFELKNKLQALGHEVFSFGFGDKLIQGDDFLVLPKSQSKLTQFLGCFFPNFFIINKLKNLLLHWQPDVIHLHNHKQHSASIFFAIKAGKVVQTVHDYGYICPVGQNIHTNLAICSSGFNLKCFFKHQVKYSFPIYLASIFLFYINRYRFKKIIQHYLTPSPLLENYLSQQGFSPVSYVPPFKNQFRSLSFTLKENKHFLFVGNLGAHKGIYLLLNEFVIALNSCADLHLTLIGKGQLENFIQQFIINNHLSNNVQLLPWQDNLSSYYQRCAAVIFPSLWMEAFGMVITEAMSYAKPIIGSNRGSVPWLVKDQETGLIFNPQIKGDLADKILYLAKNPAIGEYLGKQACETLQPLFDNEKSLEKIVSIYQRVAHLSTP